MNGHEREKIITAALQRSIIGPKGYLTNIEFARYLFGCGHDMLPFADALLAYGYTTKDFSTETLTCLQRCYDIGVAHLKHELSAAMIHDNNKRAAAMRLLQDVFEMYEQKEGSSHKAIHINITPTDKPEGYVNNVNDAAKNS